MNIEEALSTFNTSSSTLAEKNSIYERFMIIFKRIHKEDNEINTSYLYIKLYNDDSDYFKLIEALIYMYDSGKLFLKYKERDKKIIRILKSKMRLLRICTSVEHELLDNSDFFHILKRFNNRINDIIYKPLFVYDSDYVHKLEKAYNTSVSMEELNTEIASYNTVIARVNEVQDIVIFRILYSFAAKYVKRGMILSRLVFNNFIEITQVYFNFFSKLNTFNSKEDKENNYNNAIYLKEMQSNYHIFPDQDLKQLNKFLSFFDKNGNYIKKVYKNKTVVYRNRIANIDEYNLYCENVIFGYRLEGNDSVFFAVNNDNVEDYKFEHTFQDDTIIYLITNPNLKGDKCVIITEKMRMYIFNKSFSFIRRLKDISEASEDNEIKIYRQDFSDDDKYFALFIHETNHIRNPETNEIERVQEYNYIMAYETNTDLIHYYDKILINVGDEIIEEPVPSFSSLIVFPDQLFIIFKYGDNVYLGNINISNERDYRFEKFKTYRFELTIPEGTPITYVKSKNYNSIYIHNNENVYSIDLDVNYADLFNIQLLFRIKDYNESFEMFSIDNDENLFCYMNNNIMVYSITGESRVLYPINGVIFFNIASDNQKIIVKHERNGVLAITFLDIIKKTAYNEILNKTSEDVLENIYEYL